MEKSRLTDIAFVRNDIMVLTFVSGRLEDGIQHYYDVKEGDRLEKGRSNWVIRDGKRYGILVDGVGGQRIWRPEVYIEQEFNRDMLNTIRLTSQGNPNQNLVKGVVWKCKPIDASDPGMHFIEEYTVTLLLNEALKRNEAYHLHLDQIGCDCTERFVKYQPEITKSPAVHATQVGYRCDDGGKVAYVSFWAGAYGGIDYDEVSFQVIDRDANQCVYEGVGQKYTGKDPVELENGDAITVLAPVWRLDFTPVSRPGNYHIYVKDAGISYPFRIDRQVWRDAFRVAMTGLLHHRSGIELDGTLTDYIRPRCFHPDDGKLYYQSTCSLMESGNGLNALGTDTGNFGNLVKGCTDQLVPNVWGGYFDACDWDRRIQHLYCSNLLLELYTMYPDYFDNLKLAVPESGNDLPDIINESLYNLDFYRRLQLPEGGIRGGAECEEHPKGGECGWQDSYKAMVYAPDHWSSYSYAATAAFAAYCLGDHPLSAVYAESAIRAAKWGMEEEVRAAGRPYREGARYAAQQAKNHMAVQLYRLTGDVQYHEIFEATMDRLSSDAAFAYIHCNRAKKQALVDQCIEALVRRAEYGCEFSENNPYNIVVANPHRNTRGYGHLYSVPDSINMLRLYYLTGNKHYLDVAVRALNVPNGANPMDLSYTTGVGVKQPYGVLHHDSRRTGQKVPDGITIYGNFNLTRANPRDVPRYASEGTVMVPCGLEYPSMESYLGVYLYPSQTEYTVTQTICRSAYYWGFLAARD